MKKIKALQGYLQIAQLSLSHILRINDVVYVRDYLGHVYILDKYFTQELCMNKYLINMHVYTIKELRKEITYANVTNNN